MVHSYVCVCACVRACECACACVVAGICPTVRVLYNVESSGSNNKVLGLIIKFWV